MAKGYWITFYRSISVGVSAAKDRLAFIWLACAY
jgi:hypothetical protein